MLLPWIAASDTIWSRLENGRFASIIPLCWCWLVLVVGVVGCWLLGSLLLIVDAIAS